MTTQSISNPAGVPSEPAHVGLRARLKVETRELHQLAERSGIMKALLRGRVERAGYCLLLRNLHEIYAALEAGLETHFDHPMLAPILFRALFRLEALESDLNHLCGNG